MSRQTLSRWERGDSLPSDALTQICDLTGVRADWLLFGDGPMRRGDEVEYEEPAPRHYYVRDGTAHYLYEAPVLARVPAGPGQVNTDADLPPGFGFEGSIPVPDPGDENAFALIVDGDSMLPELSPGDIVVVSPRRKFDRRYPHAVVKVENESVMVKYLDIEGETAVLSSANPAYRPIRLPAKDVETIGRVVLITRQVKG